LYSIVNPILYILLNITEVAFEYLPFLFWNIGVILLLLAIIGSVCHVLYVNAAICSEVLSI